MGEAAEMMLDGTCCEACGEFIGDATGFPGYCSRECAKDRGVTYPIQAMPSSNYENPRHKKREKRRNRRQRKKRNRDLRLKNANTSDWMQRNSHHFQKTIEGLLVNWWPSRRKIMIEGQIFTEIDTQEDIARCIRGKINNNTGDSI